MAVAKLVGIDPPPQSVNTRINLMEGQMSETEIWELEHGFWLRGPEFYEAHLSADTLMIFPGMGILDRASILDSLHAVPRWTDVQMTDRRSVYAGGVAFLAYVAAARRHDETRYSAYCGSSYTRQNGNWRLLAHQQTPVLNEASGPHRRKY